MGGLMFFAIVGLWIYLLRRFVNAFDSRMPKPPWRQVVKVLLFATLLPLPLIDEIVGGRQFAKLCEANVVRIDRETARGRIVYLERASPPVDVPRVWIKVTKHLFRYLDAKTDEVVLSFDYFYAEGGRLFPGFDSGPSPLTFNGTCRPLVVPDKAYFKTLDLVEIERPQRK